MDYFQRPEYVAGFWDWQTRKRVRMLIREYRITLPMTVEEYQVHTQLLGVVVPIEADILLNTGGTAIFSGRGLKK